VDTEQRDEHPGLERFPALAARLRERYEAPVMRADYRLYAKRHDP